MEWSSGFVASRVERRFGLEEPRAALEVSLSGRAHGKRLSLPDRADFLDSRLTVHIHAIGDLAVKDSLDAFEAARKANPTTTLPFVLTHAQFVDPEIYRWMYPARSILDTGGEIAGASDWPVSTANPFEAIFQAETRSGPQGVLDPAQRMPRLAMLYAYTRDSAEVLNLLSDIGTLAPGKRADLALIDRDVLTVSAEELKGAAVVFTMFGGKLVYGHEP